MTLDLTDTIIYDTHFLTKEDAVEAAVQLKQRAVFVSTPVKVKKKWELSVFMRTATGKVERQTTEYIKDITEVNNGYIASWKPRTPPISLDELLLGGD